MKRNTVILFAILSAAWLGGHQAEAQVRPQTGPVPVVVLPPPPPPPMRTDTTGLQPQTFVPRPAPSLTVTSPPAPARAEAVHDGGDSDCLCPNGQTANAGWCWLRTDPTSASWSRMDKCQK